MYCELKYILQNSINHAFDYLASIICWECDVKPGETITDVAGNKFRLDENELKNVTHTNLSPMPGVKLNHTIQLVVLKRLLEQTRKLGMVKNPKPVRKR